MTKRARNARGKPSAGPRLTVGIGASAGGLKPLRALLGAVPDRAGLCLIVLQHRAKGRAGDLAALLAKETALTVLDATNGERLTPDTVLVVPPGMVASVFESVLRLREPEQHELARTHPIDVLFKSLACSWRDRAAAVVLSGEGADGAEGVAAVHDAGGAVFVEKTLLTKLGTEAETSAMPQAAIATGIADLVAPCEEIAAKLGALAEGLNAPDPAKLLSAEENSADVYLANILDLLRDRTGRDFHQFKRNMLLRRIVRRMQLSSLSDAASYLARLQEDPGEVARLRNDLLIPVSRFFRDPEAFEHLRTTVIVPLVSRLRDGGAPIRIWVAGCGAGEEAYTLAILLREAADRICPETPLAAMIFATDASPTSVGMARRGVYPASIEADLSESRLTRFFARTATGYQVKPAIRELCLFSEQDLVADPPFSRLDLITCRNVLIYFDADLQRRVLPLFHFALRPDGYLMLGMAENVTQAQGLFEPVDVSRRIFRRAARPTRLGLFFSGLRGHREEEGHINTANARRAPSMDDRLDRLVLEKFGPPFVIIDRNFNILRFSRRTGRFLEHPGGAPRVNLLEMARVGLRAPLRAAVDTVARTGEEWTDRVETFDDVDLGPVDLSVSPLNEGAESLYLVVFQTPVVSLEASTVPATDNRSRAEALERELAAVRADLGSTIEELSASAEEQQAANEELQSSNEELQTSKEEAQSINEELETVNEELNEKVAELDRAYADLKNLLNSGDVAVVFLDKMLCVMNFSTAATKVFRLLDSDIGRPIEDIALRVDYPSLASDLAVAIKGQDVERNVATSDGTGKLMIRLHPYRGPDDDPDGAVISIFDITELARAEERQAQLVAAMQHRVRNILAVVRALARETRGTSETLSAFFDRFEGRLNALAAMESMVVRSGSESLDLDELIHETLRADLHGAESLSIEGPPIKLGLKPAQTMALILNELATNAIKFGAFSVPSGRIEVRWSVSEEAAGPCLAFVWRERGGPALDPGDPGRGFGRDLIESGVAYELGGTGSLNFEPDGLVCRIEFPLERV